MCFELALNECKLSASRTAAGRLFHTTGPATEKALSPNFRTSLRDRSVISLYICSGKLQCFVYAYTVCSGCIIHSFIYSTLIVGLHSLLACERVDAAARSVEIMVSIRSAPQLCPKSYRSPSSASGPQTNSERCISLILYDILQWIAMPRVGRLWKTAIAYY